MEGIGRQCTMTAQELLASWLATIETRVRYGEQPSSSDAEYLRIFQIDEAKHSGATIADLSDFLVSAFRAYSRLASRLDLDGWFYSWVDEMSGTLRCSISRAKLPKDLPFNCRIEPVERPDVIAETALRSRYTADIPFSELQESDWSPPEEAINKLLLPVYVRRLVQDM
jgi:hypothetical protein